MLRLTPCAAIAALALAVLPPSAQAQSYRCVGKDGKKYYGQTIPPQCVGRPVEELNKQGVVVRRIEQQSAEDRAAKEAEEKKKREQAAIAQEEARRNRALLATYAREGDIEDARKRALAENEETVKEVARRIEVIKKRQAELAKEMEFYKGGNQPPAKLQSDVRAAQVDLEAQQNLLQVKSKEVDAINARYDEDRKRYLELTKRK